MALGDSVSEGWCDPVAVEGEPWFGWSDRLALGLDAEVRRLGGPRLAYANLAVRGRRVIHVVEDQIPAARALRPDLVSIQIGGNDLLTLGDPDRLAAELEEGIRALRADGTDVLLATAFDPGRTPLLRGVRVRAALYNAHLAAIAHRHGCLLLDLWDLPGLRGPGGWAPDRIHPSPRGHLHIADAAARVLRLPSISRGELPEGTPAISHLRWAREHFGPWLGRRVRGVSSGDGRGPKLPELRSVDVLPLVDPSPLPTPLDERALRAPSAGRRRERTRN